MKPQSSQRPFLSKLRSIHWADYLKIIFALVLIGVVLSRTNFQQILGLKDSLHWAWLLVSFLLYCLMTVIKGGQYWVLLRRKIAYRQTLKIVVIQNALTNLVANTAGLVSYLTLFRVEQNVKLTRSGITFLITKAGDLLSMGVFLFISAWLVWERVDGLHNLVIVLLTGILVAFAFLGMVVLMRRQFLSQVEKLLRALGLLRINLIQNGLNSLETLAEQEHAVVLQMLLRGIVLSMIYMSFTMVYVYGRIQIFHIPLDFWAIIFIASLMQMVSIVPFQVFGGLGVTELTLIYLFEIFGVAGMDISAIVVGLRVLFYLFNLGVLLYLPVDIIIERLRPSKPVYSD
jgi:uncharacterized membrane protein YbhN (UPF0104 family)